MVDAWTASDPLLVRIRVFAEIVEFSSGFRKIGCAKMSGRLAREFAHRVGMIRTCLPVAFVRIRRRVCVEDLCHGRWPLE